MDKLKESLNSIYKRRRNKCEDAVRKLKTIIKDELIEWFESPYFASEMERFGMSEISCNLIEDEPWGKMYRDEKGFVVYLDNYQNDCITGYELFNITREVLSEIFNELNDDRFELKMEGSYSSSYNVKNIAIIKIKE